MSENNEQELHEKLCALILGEVTEAERAEVEAALVASPELRAEKLRLEATIGLVQETLGAPPEAQLSGEARAELTAAAGAPRGGAGSAQSDTILRPVPRRWFQSVPLGLVGAAAAVLVAWVGLEQLGSPGEEVSEGNVAKSVEERPIVDISSDGTFTVKKSVYGETKEDKEYKEFTGYLADHASRMLRKSGSAAREGGGKAAAQDDRAGRIGALASQSAPPSEPRPDNAEITDGLRSIGYAGAEGTLPAELTSEQRQNLVQLGYLGGADQESASAGLRDELVLDSLGFDRESLGLSVTLAQDESSADPLLVRADQVTEFEHIQRAMEEVSETDVRIWKVELGQGGGGPAAPGAPATAKGGGTYRGPSDSVPPSGGAAGATQNQVLRYEGARGVSPAATPTSGPSSPGPGGPSTPGAAPAAGGAAPTTGGLGAARRAKDAQPSNDPYAPQAFVDGDGESDFWADSPYDSEAFNDAIGAAGVTVNELLALGEEPKVASGSDEFFLGHGSKSDSRRRGLRLTPEQRAELVIRHCRRIPNERPRDMFFRFWGDNPFELAGLDRFSTFSVDVDTASYALARRYVKEGKIPEKAQVRTEEFVNYFDSGVPAPTEETFGIDLELAPSRFGDSPDTWMMRVVVRGKDVSAEERDPVALTFVVDVSGSMKEGGRLEMVKHSLRLLMSQLDARDSLAIVAYSNEARLVLPMTSAANRATVEEAIHQLQHGGGTNAEAGLRLGYAQALDGHTPGAQNRIVLLSDGVANIGQTDQDKLNDDVRVWREQGGIYLNTVGVGMNNHNDTFLEQLANKGDGVCNYIDDAAEAKKVLVDKFTGAFQVIARDAKIQVEFDPAQVERYRLLGYENRAIADKDFRNDKVDAGEVGAGHQVTALYELVRFGGGEPDGPLATVRVRYKAPHGKSAEGAEGETAHEIARSIDATQVSGSWSGTTPGFRQAALVAQYAEFLRRSVHAQRDSYEALVSEVDALRTTAPDPAFAEFTAVVQRTLDLLIATAPPRDQLTEAVDALRRNQYLAALYDDLRQDRRQDAADELLADLERQNAELEARVRELLQRPR